MKNAQKEILATIPVTDEIKGYTWINILGYVCSGKSVLLQSIVDNIVASDDRPIVYTFNPQGMGDETIEDARRIEKSIYLLQRNCQDDLLTRKVFIAIYEWDVLFNVVSDQERLRDAILELFWNSRKWGIVFGVIKNIGRKSMYSEMPRDTSDEMQVKLIVGNHALEIACQTWEVTDGRYLWLLQQDCPCIICRSNSIKLAIVPEIQVRKPSNS